MLLSARQEAEQGGEAGRAQATRGHCCSYSFSTAADNYNFLRSVRNAAAGRRPENTPNCLNGPAGGGKSGVIRGNYQDLFHYSL